MEEEKVQEPDDELITGPFVHSLRCESARGPAGGQLFGLRGEGFAVLPSVGRAGAVSGVHASE